MLKRQDNRLHDGHYFHAAADGSFRMEDVPPGEYSMTFHMMERPGDRIIISSMGQPKMLGTANGVVTVPESPGGYSEKPLDIGTYRVNRPGLLKVGDAVPDVTFLSLYGKTFRLPEQRGKVILLSFWYPTYKICRDELPNLNRVYERFGKEPNFAMIGYAYERKPEDVAEVAQKKGLNWPQACHGNRDEFGILSAFFDSDHVVTNILIGPDGKIIAKDLRGEKLETAVNGALENDKSPKSDKSADRAAAKSQETQPKPSTPAPILLSAKGTVLDENGKLLAGAKVCLRVAGSRNLRGLATRGC